MLQEAAEAREAAKRDREECKAVKTEARERKALERRLELKENRTEKRQHRAAVSPVAASVGAAVFTPVPVELEGVGGNFSPSLNKEGWFCQFMLDLPQI